MACCLLRGESILTQPSVALRQLFVDPSHVRMVTAVGLVAAVPVVCG